MMGIYKITNTINNKCYIGLSRDIEYRWKEHKYKAIHNKKCKNKPLYNAFKKYGIDNFVFEVLKECKEDELSDLEIFYINKYKSNNNKYGYNITGGGESGPSMSGETNPNAVCSDESIIFLRTCFLKHIYKGDAKKMFIEKYGDIKDNTFNSIWVGNSYKNIMPEVYTEENRLIHRKLAIKNRPINVGLLDTHKYVLDIRNDKLNGMRYSDAAKKYNFINVNTFNDIWRGKTFKYIQPTS